MKAPICELKSSYIEHKRGVSKCQFPLEHFMVLTLPRWVKGLIPTALLQKSGICRIRPFPL